MALADEQLGDPETQRTVRGFIREGCHVGSRTVELAGAVVERPLPLVHDA